MSVNVVLNCFGDGDLVTAFWATRRLQGVLNIRVPGRFRFSLRPFGRSEVKDGSLAAFTHAGGNSFRRLFGWHHAVQKPDQIAHGVGRQSFDKLHQC